MSFYRISPQKGSGTSRPKGTGGGRTMTAIEIPEGSAFGLDNLPDAPALPPWL